MWRYIRRYLPFTILAGLFMVGEVLMDLIQPSIMRRIVDDGILGLHSGGAGNLNLIWTLGLQMIGLVLFGGLCGSLNNVFVHLPGQNIGNAMRKDCFRRIMTFSFRQLDRFGTGSLVTWVTNDITQVQNFVSQFVRGMIRTTMLMFGSMYCMLRLHARFGQIVLRAFPFLVGILAVCLSKVNFQRSYGADHELYRQYWLRYHRGLRRILFCYRADLRRRHLRFYCVRKAVRPAHQRDRTGLRSAANGDCRGGAGLYCAGRGRQEQGRCGVCQRRKGHGNI